MAGAFGPCLLRWPTLANQAIKPALATGDMPLDRPSAPASVAQEWTLLLAASCVNSRHDERIRRLLEHPINWNALLGLADDHGASSLLHQNLSPLSDLVPLEVLARLRERYEGNVRRSLFLTRELFRILDCLNALGIDAIPHRGVTLSEIYYDDMALRPAGDIDLFVRRRDVLRMRDAIRDLGYTRRLTIPQAVEPAYIASGYEYTFDTPAEKNLLELQWSLLPRFYSVDFNMEGLFERVANATVAGRSVKTPSPKDLLLVLSIHAAKHVWARLIWLCDIAQILQREKIDWDWVQWQARDLGIQRILHITLLLAKQFLEAAIPTELENAANRDATTRTLAGETALAVAAGTMYDTQQLSYFRLMMQLRERRADRLRFLSRLAFTPGPGEWEAVRLPEPLFPLYRLVRLARLAGRFMRKKQSAGGP